MTRISMVLALASGVALAACGPIDAAPVGQPGGAIDPVPDAPADPAGDPGDEPAETRALSQEEKDALGVMLGELDGIGGFAPDWATGIDEVDEVGTVLVSWGHGPAPATTGTTGTGGPTPVVMDGISAQLVHTTAAGSLELTILIAWSGLDAATQTVDEMLVVLAPDIVDPGSVELVDLMSSNVPGAWAIYSDLADAITYFSDEGTFRIDSVTFDTEEDCTTATGAGTPSGAGTSAGGGCTVSEGTLEGDVDMTATGFSGASVIVTGSGSGGGTTGSGGGTTGSGGGTTGSGGGTTGSGGTTVTADILAEFEVPVTRITVE